MLRVPTLDSQDHQVPVLQDLLHILQILTGLNLELPGHRAGDLLRRGHQERDLPWADLLCQDLQVGGLLWQGHREEGLPWEVLLCQDPPEEEPRWQGLQGLRLLGPGLPVVRLLPASLRRSFIRWQVLGLLLCL